MARPATYIESSTNRLIKDVRRAVARSAVTRDGLWVAESFHLLDEALKNRLTIRDVLATPRARAQVETRLRGHGEIALKVVEEDLFQQIASTETTQGVIALVEPPKWNRDDLFRGKPLVIALDGVQDPGNAGAVVRCAEAFGASGVVFLKGAAHAAGPKTLRAAAGSLFRLPHIGGMTAEQLVAESKQRKLRLLAASAKGSQVLSRAGLDQGCVVVFGSEAHGISSEFRAAEQVRISTKAVESLNVSAAAAVLLYEAARQRAAQPEKRPSRRPPRR